MRFHTASADCSHSTDQIQCLFQPNAVFTGVLSPSKKLIFLWKSTMISSVPKRHDVLALWVGMRSTESQFVASAAHLGVGHVNDQINHNNLFLKRVIREEPEATRVFCF